jgi:hypothetical protein
VTLLGGATARRHGGAPPCLALVRDKDTWLFDVGEDVQRCLLWREHIKPSKARARTQRATQGCAAAAAAAAAAATAAASQPPALPG